MYALHCVLNRRKMPSFPNLSSLSTFHTHTIRIITGDSNTQRLQLYISGPRSVFRVAGLLKLIKKYLCYSYTYEQYKHNIGVILYYTKVNLPLSPKIAYSLFHHDKTCIAHYMGANISSTFKHLRDAPPHQRLLN